ncbi:MAG TPA: head-tail connector protein [Rhizomicrobium sp.]|nr:head-tail connector protein [Rhizomicrobium sp.]
MPLQLITPPAIEPVTLAEAKAHLKVDVTGDDALIGALIAAARARAEWHTGRAFITQSWVLWLDNWPERNCVEIPLPPSQAVTSFTIYATDDTATVLDASLYRVDISSGPARIALKSCALVAGLRPLNAVAIAFNAGYGDNASDVPQAIRTAILEIVAGLYTNRGDVAADPPQTAMAMLAPYRVMQL